MYQLLEDLRNSCYSDMFYNLHTYYIFANMKLNTHIERRLT